MKIPVWLLLVAIVLGGLAGYYYSTRHENDSVVVNPMQGYYDSIERVNNTLQKKVDSFDHTTAKRDTVIIKEIKYVKTYSEGVYRLPSDSSYKLFISWATMFRDSGERSRYLRTDSTGLYQ